MLEWFLLRYGNILQVFVTNGCIVCLHSVWTIDLFVIYLEIEILFIYRPFYQPFKRNCLDLALIINQKDPFIFKE